MKKSLFLCVIIGCLTYSNAYSINQRKPDHYDKVGIANRTYGSNFKDSALIGCLQIAYKKINHLDNVDFRNTQRVFWPEWIDLDFDNIKQREYVIKELDRLSEKYIAEVGHLKEEPKATLYSLGCLNFYHSNDLDKLTQKFVVHPNRTYRQDNPKYPHE